MKIFEALRQDFALLAIHWRFRRSFTVGFSLSLLGVMARVGEKKMAKFRMRFRIREERQVNNRRAHE